MVGKRRPDQREVVDGDEHRALREVEIERLLDAIGDDPVLQQQVGDRPVAVAGRPLGVPDVPVDLRPPAEVELVHRGDPVEAGLQVVTLDHVRDRDRAGVDHRVRRATLVFVEVDRVEALAGRRDADAGEDVVAPVRLEREPVEQQLRDRLDREQLLGIAEGDVAIVDGDAADREEVRIDGGELGDVGGGLALPHARVAGVQALADAREEAEPCLALLRAQRGCGAHRRHRSQRPRRTTSCSATSNGTCSATLAMARSRARSSNGSMRPQRLQIRW